ncbi:MAG: hypothetical protein GX893_04865 [Firmicutes bacterium]|nr:hypothetical protein [Bacillota bacterium]
MPGAETFVMQQFIVLFVAVILGLMMGMVFEIVDVFCNFMRISRLLQAIIDLLFCFGMTAAVFITLLHFNWGEVRAHTFLGIGTGALLYYLLLHRFVNRLLVKVLEMIEAAVQFMVKPFVMVVRLLRKSAKKLKQLLTRMETAGRKLQKKMSFLRKKKE